MAGERIGDEAPVVMIVTGKGSARGMDASLSRREVEMRCGGERGLSNVAELVSFASSRLGDDAG